MRTWRQALGAEKWTRLTVRDGEKGPVESEMGQRRVQTRLDHKRTGPAAWRVVTRRPLTPDRLGEGKFSPDATAHDGRYRHGSSLTPTPVSEAELQEAALTALARVSQAGTCMEASCKRGKGAGGLDAYQGRPWQGWHHPIALSLMAVWFLSGETPRGQQWPPALTLPPVRDGLSRLLLEGCGPLGIDSLCRHVQRQLRRNESARFYHHRTRKCVPPRKLRREIQ